MPKPYLPGNGAQPDSAFRTILYAGLVAGSLDAIAAILLYLIYAGNNPVIIFQYIASALFGKIAFTAGASMAVAGLLFHFIIAYAFSIFFFLIYPRINILSKNIWLTGLLYGAIIWVIMNLIVLPMTRLPKATFNIMPVIRGISVLMLMVGLPIALIVHRYYSSKRNHRFN